MLHEQAVVELDPERRRQLFIEMNELLTADVAVIPLYHQNWRVGISTSLTGVGLTPWDVDTWNIADWRWEE